MIIWLIIDFMEKYIDVECPYEIVICPNKECSVNPSRENL